MFQTTKCIFLMNYVLHTAFSLAVICRYKIVVNNPSMSDALNYLKILVWSNLHCILTDILISCRITKLFQQ